MVFHVFPRQPPLPFSWWWLPISSPQPPIDLEGHASGPEDYWEKVVFQTSTSVYVYVYVIYIHIYNYTYIYIYIYTYIYIYVSWDGTIPGYFWAFFGRTPQPASFVWKIPWFPFWFPHEFDGIFTNNFWHKIHPLRKKTPRKSPTEPWFLGGVDFKIAGIYVQPPKQFLLGLDPWELLFPNNTGCPRVPQLPRLAYISNTLGLFMSVISSIYS